MGVCSPAGGVELGRMSRIVINHNPDDPEVKEAQARVFRLVSALDGGHPAFVRELDRTLTEMREGVDGDDAFVRRTAYLLDAFTWTAFGALHRLADEVGSDLRTVMKLVDDHVGKRWPSGEESES